VRLGLIGGAGMSMGMQWPQERTRPRAPSDRLTVGIIGTGARAHQLMQTLLEIPDVEITAVCDAYSGRIERALQRTNRRARVYETYHDIIARDDIDAVVIATPDHQHARQAIDAMDAGKHIYIEKPLTYSAAEGPAIIEAERRNGVVVQVGSTGINSALEEKARAMIASGKLGQVTMIRAYTNRNTASGAWIYPIPPDASPDTVNWEMFLSDAPQRPFDLARFFRWRCYQDYSGGMATDLYVHLCTSIHYMMGVQMCERAVAMGGLYRWVNSRDVPDTINASLAYPEGFMVSLSGTFNNQSGGSRGIQILGTEGSLTLGNELTFTPETAHESNGWIVDSWAEEMEAAYYRDPEIRAEELPETQPQRVLEGSEVYFEEGLDAGLVHFNEFFEAVRAGGRTKESAAEGHHAAACAHMINVALEEGRVVRWDPRTDRIADS
jgi:predicted dehydrogenase